MSCYHPNYMVQIEGQMTVEGKPMYRMIKMLDVDSYPKDKVIQVPCGKCIGCRLEYSRQWANRCMLELQYHDSAFFCTFTYDQAHVPIGYSVDRSTGEAVECMTLRKRDFQLLMKRIRKRFSDDRIRFFAAGEYGSDTFRPHYHAILFGLHLGDLAVYKETYGGNVLYNSPSLDRCWCDSDGVPVGFVVVAPVTWETCAYVARYTAKKECTADPKVFQELGMEPPFTLMSRKPGIGRMYYDDHPDLYEHDFINVSTLKGGKKFRPPKYFDRLLEADRPLEAAKLKEVRRELAMQHEALVEARTSMNEYDRRLMQERIKQGQLKSLRRNQI
uniref:Replication initiator protein n=1 Tax=Dulem virus 131 TaxID=3145608 RepID=A0AAU8B6G6_9VIRU